jgi:hypothetical protein
MSLGNPIQRTMLPLGQGTRGVGVHYRGAAWLAVRGGLTRERARTLLADRWANLESSLAALRDRILSCEPVAVIQAYGATMIELIRTPTVPEGTSEVHYCVQRPKSAALVCKALARRSIIDPDPLLVDFMSAFNGLRDQPVERNGNFIPASQWRTIESLYASWWDDETGRAPKWHKDYVIYEALSGDKLLYGTRGGVGWYIHSESRYERFWSGFKGFLRFYAEFQERYYPLDFYSASDFLGRAR